MLEERAKTHDSTSKTGTRESCRRASSAGSEHPPYGGDTASRRKTAVLAGDVLDYVYSYYRPEVIKGENIQDIHC